MRPLRYWVRQLAQAPGFATAVLLTLAIGIGACVSIFSLVDGIVLRPLPYPEPERLITINETMLPQLPQFAVAPGQYLEWRAQATSFEALAALRQRSYSVTGTGEPVRVSALEVTSDLFPILGASPVLGRTFSSAEATAGEHPVLVLGHGFWLRHFGGRPDVLDQTMTLDGRRFEIVGVMPASFELVGTVDLFTPMVFGAADRENRGAHSIAFVLGRLKAGVALGQARSELTVLAQRTAEQFPATNKGWGVKLTPLREVLLGDVTDLAFMLLGAVGFLLLIACANVANLLLVRAAARTKEMAIRTALGATPGRIFRQLLLDNLFLGVLGAALGMIVGYAGMKALLAFAPEGLPRAKEVGIDLRVLGFACGLAIVTGVVFGVFPAAQAARVDLNETLKETSRSASAGRKRGRARSVLVAAEVALAFVLLVGAGLFVTSFTRLHSANRGFVPQKAIAVALALAPNAYKTPSQQTLFAQRAVDALSALPGIQAVGASQTLPLSGGGLVYAIGIDGHPVGGANMLVAHYNAVTPRYLDAMGISLLQGRAFDAHDTDNAKPVALINQTAANRLWPGEDPIGKRLTIPNRPESWREIVGVVADVSEGAPGESIPLQVYEPFNQAPSDALTIVLRTSGEAAGLTKSIRAALSDVDRDQPVTSIRPLTQYVADSLAGERFAMFLFSVFSAIALFLAGVGIYGVMAFTVAERTGEIGIRLALGAPSRAVLRLVLAQAARLVGVGLAFGAVVSVLLTRALGAVFFGMGADDPTTFVRTSVLLALVAAVACLVPARRAVRVDPMVALRMNSP